MNLVRANVILPLPGSKGRTGKPWIKQLRDAQRILVQTQLIVSQSLSKTQWGALFQYMVQPLKLGKNVTLMRRS